jgi:acylphosphatase
VQGVYFRAEAQNRARSLRIGGWVRNAADGSVEAVFEGEDERVESMVAWCRRGPPGARVDDAEVVWEEPQGETAFRVVG